MSKTWNQLFEPVFLFTWWTWSFSIYTRKSMEFLQNNTSMFRHVTACCSRLLTLYVWCVLRIIKDVRIPSRGKNLRTGYVLKIRSMKFFTSFISEWNIDTNLVHMRYKTLLFIFCLHLSHKYRVLQNVTNIQVWDKD